MSEDMVNSPPHYNQKGIECIDAIEAATDDGFQYYLQGNILKYIWRYRYKGGKEDLEKAQLLGMEKILPNSQLAAEELALKNSPTVIIAKLAEKAASQELQLAQVKQNPSLALRGEYKHHYSAYRA